MLPGAAVVERERREESTTRSQVHASGPLCMTRVTGDLLQLPPRHLASSSSSHSCQSKTEMSAAEDDDIKLQRASASLLSDFEQLLPRLLRKRKHDSIPARFMYTACALVRLDGYITNFDR
jgi:hypothetical protein